MSDFVLLHGAFRGPWAWERVVPLLEAAGHRAFAVDLTGDDVTLDSYVDAVVAVYDEHDLRDAVLVGHSQGGFVARAATQLVAARTARVVYLDAPVPEPGETAFDFRPSGVPPPPVQWGDVVPPRPVAAGPGLSQADADWINERLVAQAVAPSMHPVELSSARALSLPSTFAFFADAPPGFPCDITRERLDAAGEPYSVLPGPHDAPITNPRPVVDFLVDVLVG